MQPYNKLNANYSPAYGAVASGQAWLIAPFVEDPVLHDVGQVLALAVEQ